MLDDSIAATAHGLQLHLAKTNISNGQPSLVQVKFEHSIKCARATFTSHRQELRSPRYPLRDTLKLFDTTGDTITPVRISTTTKTSNTKKATATPAATPPSTVYQKTNWSHGLTTWCAQPTMQTTYWLHMERRWTKLISNWDPAISTEQKGYRQ